MSITVTERAAELATDCARLERERDAAVEAKRFAETVANIRERQFQVLLSVPVPPAVREAQLRALAEAGFNVAAANAEATL
jgi:hypothetical protein